MAALSVGELLARITADDSGFRRGLRAADSRMRDFGRDLGTQLRTLYDRFVERSRAMGQAFTNTFTNASAAARRGMQAFTRFSTARLRSLTTYWRMSDDELRDGISAADLRLAGFVRDASGRMRTLSGRFVDETETLARLVADGLARGGNQGMRRMVLNVRSRFRSLQNSLRGDSDDAGTNVGRNFATRMLSSISSTLRAGIGSAFSSAMTGLRSLSGSVGSNPVVGMIAWALAVAVAAAFAPALGAMLGGLIVSVSGIGIVGLGVALLKNEPEVKKAAEKLTNTIKTVFKAAAQPMAAPLKQAILGLEETAREVAPQIKGLFRNLVDAGAINRLKEGLDGLVKNTLPGLGQMMRTSAPVWEGMRVLLEKIGSGLSKMFNAIGTKSPEMGQALKDLGTVIEMTLLALGGFLAFLADMYGKVRPYLVKVVQAFQWMYDVLVGHSIVPDMVNAIIMWFAQLPIRAGRVLSSLPGVLFRAANDAGARMRRAISNGLDSANRLLGGLPGRARRALGGLGGTLYSAGQGLIRGFISGINSMLGSLRATLGGVTAMLPDWKGPAERDATILTPAGRSVIQGFQDGIAAQVPSLQRQLQGLTGSMPGMAMGPMGLGGVGAAGGRREPIVIELRGPGLTDVIRDIVQVNGRGDVAVAFNQR